MNRYFIYLGIALQLFIVQAYGQHSVSGRLTANGKGIPGATLALRNTNFGTTTDSKGKYQLEGIPDGNYILQAFSLGYDSVSKDIRIAGRDLRSDIELTGNTSTLKAVTIQAEKEKTLGITRLKDVDGMAIYAGKKNEVIVIKDLVANTASNNTRQIYSKVAGLNIWENDGAGIQLAIGGRGLDPNRTSNFNTRQNGYDISADALGYPESYYTPPAELVDQIEIVRGAASLQYGTQFGGLVNFKLNKGSDSEKIHLTSRETGGSWGFFNTSNTIGGTIKKLNYIAFYQHKSGNGWRPNSHFNVNTAYLAATLNLSPKLSITAQYTFMDYLEHQPGGLTDKGFADDPRASIRQRNWFKVNWNLGAIIADYALSRRLKFNTRFFGLASSRSAVGILTYINRADPGGPRDLWTDHYTNWGNESRLLYTYHTKTNPFNLLVGARYYNGHTDRRQGEGNSRSSGNKSDFEFTDPSGPDYTKFDFPNYNTSVFAENIFRFGPKFSLIPGIRYENIVTKADGFYSILNKDLAGNIVYTKKVDEYRSSSRSFVLGGIGMSYYQSNGLQLYANISQNYRSINFNDIWVVNPNFRVDPNMKDEKGYSADIGARGRLSDVFYYDLSLFMIAYNNKIGTILQVDSSFNIYRYRTNVGASRNIGVEAFAEVDIWKLLMKERAKMKLAIFCNLSFIDAHYLDNKIAAYSNKKVELVPAAIVKTGITFRKNRLAGSYQFAYTGKQFTDATNAPFTSNAINGIIPAYYVMDLSTEYNINKIFSLQGTINNISNKMYFTRRADSYPGPGIIPSDGRSFYLTLQVNLGY